MKKIKRITALVLCFVMLFSLCACGTTATTAETAAPEATPEATEEVAEEEYEYVYSGTSGDADDYFIPVVDSIDSFETKTTTLYMNDLEKTSDIEIGILNGIEDIPYLSLQTVAQILIDMHKVSDEDTVYDITVDDATGDGTTFILMRENESVMVVNCADSTITFTDIETFVQNPKSVSGLDLVDTCEQSGGTFIKHINAFYRTDAAEIIDLAHYGITCVAQDGIGYIPMQTVADLLVSRSGAYLLWNGEEMIVADTIEDPSTGDLMTEAFDETFEETIGDDYVPMETAAPEKDDSINTISDLYYSAEKGEKSEELARFTYNELCLGLDYNYGLQDAHNIKSFNQLFLYSGISDQLLSTDAAETYRALAKVTGIYFNDFHSGMDAPSYLADINTTTDEEAYTASMGYNNDATINFSMYQVIRDYFVMTDGFEGYEEVGDTAYITFDSFNFDPERDYYTTDITNNKDDTIELILYANQQIRREGSPIKNVVVDLSCNGGGYLDTAAALLAWMLGGVSINIQDPITGNEGSTVYYFDGNMNGNASVGEQDDYLYLMVNGLNLYAIISPNSFSCGNLVPAMLSQSERVTLIGRSSGGGACCVLPFSSADGQVFQISGPYRISTVQNGSYYDVDQGVEPDIYIDDITHLYDREYMTNLIDNLD